MAVLSLDQRMEFLDAIDSDVIAELAVDLPDELAGAPEVNSGEEAGYVDQGSLTSFVAHVSRQNRSDILNSTLLAQLVATKDHDPFTSTGEWYESYREVLEHVGWTVQSFDFDEYEAAASNLTVDAIVLKILEAVMGGAHLAIVKAAIDALRGISKDDDRFTIFDRSSHDVHSANFRLSAVSEDNGAAAMAMAAFYFETSKRIENVLFFHFGDERTALHHAAQVATLNSDVYSQVREPILAKLGADAQKLVARLPDLH